ncbi:dTDP-4-dehydrorhamnose reductase [Foetidibacter luteolus]|uniref:dTDP-4-dehydrorhamnose reductase n=1 Tax=Foetidibacter luteolus TaxID=2608880 RepID=UPI00129B1A55|nr:dTDP-4-dehydrorhamnose reductase [Foetidibacter luteolus]
MSKPVILVTGKNGQLGHALQTITPNFEDYHFVFLGREEADLSNPHALTAAFEKYQPAYFVNCAAYTAVDKAESDQENAYKVNGETVGAIAMLCKQYNTKLIHISTDYVFNGQGTAPYPVNHPAEPVNYYGYSKWIGEKLALENNPQTVIIRTSWVYSYYGNNFVKTMLRLMKERPEIRVVSDQLGSPTYAFDLADAIMAVIKSGSFVAGVYHYSNAGIISWYDFAVAIRDKAQLNSNVLPIPTTAYPTPAKRPAYSAMDTTKIHGQYNLADKPWQQSLELCLRELLKA